MSDVVKYTKGFLNKVEDIFSESEYHLRYEKGNFQSGYCILKDKNIVMVNKYYSLEGKVNCLVEILQKLQIDTTKVSDANKKLLASLRNAQLSM